MGFTIWRRFGLLIFDGNTVGIPISSDSKAIYFCASVDYKNNDPELSLVRPLAPGGVL